MRQLLAAARGVSGHLRRLSPPPRGSGTHGPHARGPFALDPGRPPQPHYGGGEGEREELPSVERPFAPAPALLDVRRTGGGGPEVPATWSRQWWALPAMRRIWVIGFQD